jgi:hypothetical protein
MALRLASICLLFVAVLVAGACRTRLPVEPVVTAATPATPEAIDVPSTRPATDLSAFLRDDGGAEQVSTDPLGPFLAEVRTDRLQDMVRRDLITGQPRGPWTFRVELGPVCVPARHR